MCILIYTYLITRFWGYLSAIWAEINTVWVLMEDNLGSDCSLRFTSVLPWLKTVPVAKKTCDVMVKATDFGV